MPVTGTPATNPAAPAISRDDVRMYLRDFSGNNVLLDDVQFSDAEISKAMDMAVDEWNVMTPIGSDTSATVPKSILMLGTAAWLMQSESFLQIRNQATYQDGDIAPIGIDDKQALYANMAASLKAEWKSTAKQFKIQKNMESAYGGFSSGYAGIGRWNG